MPWPAGASAVTPSWSRTRLALGGQSLRGERPAKAEEIVVCPICGCKIVVTADAQP